MDKDKGAILVVDDEAPVRDIVSRMLRSKGYECAIASDGKEALDVMAKRDFDVLLLDIKMPGLSGIEVLPQIIAGHPDSCVIMATAVVDLQAAVEAMKLGAYDYLTKPFSLDTLTMRVEKALERKRLVKENRDYRIRLAEQALRESEEQYSALVENIADAVFRLADKTISWCNDRVEEIYGYTKNELIGKDSSFLLSSDIGTPEFAKLVYNATEGGHCFRGTTKTKRKDETLIDVEFSVSRFPGKDPPEFIAVVRDITDRRVAEDELKKARDGLEIRVKQRTAELAQANEELRLEIEERRRAEEALRRNAEQLEMKNNELTETRRELSALNEGLERKVRERTAEVERLLVQKDAFISQLGHDLKTPLTPLMALLPVLMKREQDPKSRELLSVISQNVNYMKELVIKTLELARLSRSDAAMTFDDIELSRQVQNVLEESKTILEEKRIQVENRIDEEIIVKADSLRLREVLNNIISNAVKFTPQNGTLTIDAKHETDFVTVSVRDTGIGMTAEQISHIFDEFYKADPSRHELASTGLGLSICKRIVEKHGGKIWASSQGLGKGSTLFFILRSGNGRTERDYGGKGR